MLKYYNLYGMIIKTNIDFNDHMIQIEAQKNYDLRVILNENINLDLHVNSILIHSRYYENGDPFLIIKKTKTNDYIFEIMGYLTIIYREKIETIYVKGPVDSNFMAAFFSVVISKVMYSKGIIQIHGSAVKYKNCKLGFVGNSGTGKSTVAGFCLMDGGSLIADDIIAFDRNNLKFLPAPPTMRVLNSSEILKKGFVGSPEEDKIKINLKHYDMYFTKSSYLEYIFILEVDNEKGLTCLKIDKNDKVLEILKYLYCNYLLDFNDLLKIVPLVVKIISNISIYKIIRKKCTEPKDILNVINSICVDKR